MATAVKEQNAVKQNVAIIGAGFGGLALAMRLQSAGKNVTIIEARDKAGIIGSGRALFLTLAQR